MTMRSMPPASSHLAESPVPAPPPTIGSPRAIIAWNFSSSTLRSNRGIRHVFAAGTRRRGSDVDGFAPPSDDHLFTGLHLRQQPGKPGLGSMYVDHRHEPDLIAEVS